jgi:benzoate/toluate 1,2-dioxygenase beta subunit
MSFDYADVRDFLHLEARYLDDKRWDEWLDLYCRDVQFWIPAWDDDGKLTEDPQKEISLMYYARRDGLEDRIFRIRTGKSAASTPEHRTNHLLGNIEILENGDSCVVRFNWVTHSSRYGLVTCNFGTTTCQLVRESGAIRIKKKTVILKSDRIDQVLDIYHV